MSRSVKKMSRPRGQSGDPQWYRDAVIYQLHVRSFYDSNDDGMGDFPGLTQQLPYLEDLGVTALWLLPFYPSPWRDDGYDIADYTDVHPAYGTRRDFQQFLREAHRRGLRVITELVVNHTSDQHAWFQRARRAKPGSRERDFYVWSDTPDKYTDARIIFKDFEASNWTWDPVAQAYFWHRFYSHQPDLNFDNPAVHRALLKVADFWLDMGVDGVRLDAVPYLFEREGTNCENLPETHEFLRKLRKHIDDRYDDRMLLAEANQWPEDAVNYFGDGDECHMAFHFPVMPRLFMGLHMEDRYPIIEILEQTPKIPEGCQWAMFLRNHDELTLEMVTDAERDYMYRAYASENKAKINLGIRRRLAPLLSNNRRRIELMNSLLFSLPGTPVVYYGDEIGMGDNVFLGDRNGVRTPLQWNADRNAGFSRANPQQLFLPVITDPEYRYEAVNVESQQDNAASLLWWMKRLIALRKQAEVFGRGTLEFLQPENPRVLTFLRRHEGQVVLIVANLSRFSQWIELDLSEFVGHEPVDLFGSTRFPTIRETPYFLTIGPHSFYWFALEPVHPELVEEPQIPERSIATLENADWHNLLETTHRAHLLRALRAYLQRVRWFGGKARQIRKLDITETIPISNDGFEAGIVWLKVDYAAGEPDTFALSLAIATGEDAYSHRERSPQAVIAPLTIEPDEDAILFDAAYDARYADALLDIVERRRSLRGHKGRLLGTRTSVLRRLLKEAPQPLTGQVLRAEQSNTTIVYKDDEGEPTLLMKCLRRIESGLNPDLEISRHLTEEHAFEHTPALAGALELQPQKGEPATVAMAQVYVPNEGDAWRMTLQAVSTFCERALTREADFTTVPPVVWPVSSDEREEIPVIAVELIGPYLTLAQLLGQRTAEMHLALAADTENAGFTPESFSDHYRRGLYQAISSDVKKKLDQLRKQLRRVPSETRNLAQELIDARQPLLAELQRLTERRISGKRTRIHGDYHLGQVLFTGKDFAIIDFEGEPARPLTVRRLKRSPLYDVAGMVRSLHYASEAALRGTAPDTVIREQDRPLIHSAAQFWFGWVTSAFLGAYFAQAEKGDFLPRSVDERRLLLHALIIEKATYELNYELNNRPNWVEIPIVGMLQLLESVAAISAGRLAETKE